jgi:uncharacterized protein YjbJ (UPF0337 family)
MNNDKVIGATKVVEGTAQSVFGAVTGNPATELKGDAKRVRGVAQDALGKAEDYVCDSMDSVKTKINNEPLKSALIALGIGFVLGKIFRL